MADLNKLRGQVTEDGSVVLKPLESIAPLVLRELSEHDKDYLTRPSVLCSPSHFMKTTAVALKLMMHKHCS